MTPTVTPTQVGPTPRRSGYGRAGGAQNIDRNVENALELATYRPSLAALALAQRAGMTAVGPDLPARTLRHGFCGPDFASEPITLAAPQNNRSQPSE
jgi:hypothetical protein